MLPARVISIHFPKAAGTSLWRQLSTSLGESMVLDYDHDPLVIEGVPSAEFPYGKRLVHGHFHAGRYLSSDAYRMTFLRHPVDNVISIYNFWNTLQTSNNPVHLRFLAEKPSIEDFAAYSGVRTLMSESYFGGFPMDRFDFVGFYERREVDIPRLSEALGLPLSAEFYENKTVSADEKLIPSTRSRLTDILAEDVKFYERELNKAKRFA